MVQRIGAIYGTDFSLKSAQNMVLEILRAWGLMAAAEYGLHLAADLLRTVTFGTSTILTAVPQGLAAAWSTYVVGNAANIYFRDAGWSGRSPKDIVKDILAGAEKNKTSILGPIRDQLMAKFGRTKNWTSTAGKLQRETKGMIGRLNHVAIAVRDIGKAAAVYRDVLGAEVSAAVPQPDHGVTTVFVTLPNTKIELFEPLGEASPIAKFLERNPDGGMHHLCYEVDDIRAARDALQAAGLRVLGDGEPKTGAHGKPVLFLHPKDFSGTLVELEQA